MINRTGGLAGVDGKLDGLWTCRRGAQTFIYNSTAKAVQTEIDGQPAAVQAHAIWMSPDK